MIDEQTSPRFIVAGRLTRDYQVFPTGKTLLDVPGGSAMYAAVGLAAWEPQPPPGIVARVGEDYPHAWIDNFKRWGFDTRGIHVLPQALDVRQFTAFTDRSTRSGDDPVLHFARLGVPFPKALLGYKSPVISLDSKTQLQPTSLRQNDLPSDFLDATAAHLCPLDYLAHSVLPAVLRQADFTTITIDPSPGYMNPTFWSDVPALLTGLTAFLPSEDEVRALFQGRTGDLWEMAAGLAAYGCEIIVIKRGQSGQYVYDAGAKTRWEIPSYPVKVVNPVGAGDAFCGGFLAGYRRTFDPLEAALQGCIAASMVVEGDQVNYALEALPGLAQARCEALRQGVRKL